MPRQSCSFIQAGVSQQCKSKACWERVEKKHVHAGEIKLGLTSDFHLFERPRSDPGGVLLLNCSVPCGRAQSGFFLLLVCPFSKCMGLNGLCKWMTAVFFYKYSSWLNPISVAIIPNINGSFVFSALLWRSPLFSCVLIFRVGDFPFCLLLLFSRRTCQKFWDRTGPPCVRGLGLVLVVVFVFVVVRVELWSPAPTAGRWWAAPRWPSCCVTWWPVSSQLKTSLPDVRLGYRLTVALKRGCTVIWVSNYRTETFSFVALAVHSLCSFYGTFSCNVLADVCALLAELLALTPTIHFSFNMKTKNCQMQGTQ